LANWGIVFTLFIGCVLTAFVIAVGNRRDAILRKAETEREERVASINMLAAEASERASAVDERASHLEVEAEEPRLTAEKDSGG
jgi:hypothetical protein